MSKVLNSFIPVVTEKTASGERMLDLFSRLLRDRVVFVTGEITEDTANAVVGQLLLLEAEGPEEDIFMYINSPGGSISAMFGIFDTMQYIKSPVVTIGFGTVASAASFLLAAGEPGKRYALKNSEIMVHELSSGAMGKYTDIKNTSKHLTRLHDKLINYYSEFTGASKKKLEEDMKVDFFLTAEEAANYGKKGLIDKVQERSFR